MLAPNFMLGEFLSSDTAEKHGLKLTPTPEAEQRLWFGANAVLQPWRDRVGALGVTSGFRTEELNRLLKGSKTSQHLRGEAADILVRAFDRDKAFKILWEMAQAGLPVDQAIIYRHKGHIHVSWAPGRAPRRQFLVSPAKGEYLPWSP